MILIRGADVLGSLSKFVCVFQVPELSTALASWAVAAALRSLLEVGSEERGFTGRRTAGEVDGAGMFCAHPRQCGAQAIRKQGDNRNHGLRRPHSADWSLVFLLVFFRSSCGRSVGECGGGACRGNLRRRGDGGENVCGQKNGLVDVSYSR